MAKKISKTVKFNGMSKDKKIGYNLHGETSEGKVIASYIWNAPPKEGEKKGQDVEMVFVGFPNALEKGLATGSKPWGRTMSMSGLRSTFALFTDPKAAKVFKGMLK